MLEKAFFHGEAAKANTLIATVRDQVEAAQGQAVNYEISLMDREWEHLVETAAPRLAHYLREKRLGVFNCAPVVVTLFRGNRVFFVHGPDFFAGLRNLMGLDEATFRGLAQGWERSGRTARGALPLHALSTDRLASGEETSALADRTALQVLAGGLLMVGFDGPEAPLPLLRRIEEGRIGGVILFSRNIREPEQVARLTRTLSEAAPADRPLLIGVDQEGGRVQRLREPMARWPAMRKLGQIDDEGLTRAVGQALGQDLALLGFNLDFAPVLDVVANAENTVIGDRSFGPEAEQVSRHALALCRGLLAGGVLPCGKHFPGHGGPVADSHHALPVERRSVEALRQLDLRPFAAAIADGIPMLMSAHVVYEGIDPAHPGTLSPAVNIALLRRDMGFSGTLVSDDLDMAAIASGHGPAEAALAAMRAGVDLLLICSPDPARQEQALAALTLAGASSEQDRDRLAEAAGRVAALRRRLPEPKRVSPETAAAEVRAQVHAVLLTRLA